VNPQLLSIIDQLPGYWGCKDTNSVFVYTNQAYANLVGLESAEQSIGLNDFDIPSPTSKCAQDFRNQDVFVMEKRTSLKVLDIHPYPDGRWRAHIFTKTPWLNNNGEVIGTIFYGQDLSDTAILEVGHWICRATGLPTNQALTMRPSQRDKPLNLTPRESEALFLLLYGKKPHYIAEAMNISIKTLESHVARLRAKFGAHTKAQLVDMALEQGCASYIPPTLLKTQISVALNSEYAA